MFDIAITITMIIAGIICGGAFWHFGVKGFKGVALTVCGAVLGAAAAYWFFILISFVIWMLINTGTVA
jgi:hypothetical protein